MSNAFLHAQEVCKYLEKDKRSLDRCLTALKNNEDGQIALAQGEPQKALDYLLKAEADFDALPPATFLLGITRAGIAAAYADLRKLPDAAKYARSAIEIAKQDSAFAETEANARMTLANALGIAGDVTGAKEQYELAERIYLKLPNTEAQLQALKQNRSVILGNDSKSNGRDASSRNVLVVILLLLLIGLFVYWKWIK